MNNVRTIDSHTHILTEEAMRLLGKESPVLAPVVKGRGTAQVILEINGRVVQDPMPAEIWDVDLRLKDMDANGVDVQVLSPTVFTFFYGADAELALTAAAIQNEEIAAVVKRHPQRFIGLGSVPLQAPDKAAAELRRAVTKLGLRGAMIGTRSSVAVVLSRNIPAMKKIRFAMTSRTSGSLDNSSKVDANICGTCSTARIQPNGRSGRRAISTAPTTPKGSTWQAAKTRSKCFTGLESLAP